MAKKEIASAQQLIADIQNKRFEPVYFLMGEEPYFIDQITDALIENVLTETEKDFNQTIFYGEDTKIENVITAARRYPMMSEHQLIVLREAQQIADLDMLENYLKKPLLSTILVINYKYKKYDTRKKLMKEIANMGVVFESKRIYDDKIPAFVQQYVAAKGVGIDGKSALMIAGFVGSDLTRLCSELDKLMITLPAGQLRITPEIVEQNIGISKDFNNFELLKAVIIRDIYKANLIQVQFAKNPRANPLVVTMAVLFNFFSNLMLSFYATDRSEQGIAAALGLKNPYMAREYQQAMKSYNAYKTMAIISLLRTYDAKSKGFENSHVSDSELLKELLYKMMH